MGYQQTKHRGYAASAEWQPHSNVIGNQWNAIDVEALQKIDTSKKRINGYS